MPVFTSITRSGVRVTMPEQVSPCTVTIGGVQITLPAEAGPGIDLVASDVRGDVWAACTGVANDRGYLLKLSDGSRTVLPGQVSGRYPVWITEDGDVSWVPASDRMQVFHLDGTTSDARDAHHPLAPNESDVKVWDAVEVVNVFSHGDWACATYAHDEPGLQTVLLRKHGGPVLSAGTFRTQLPPHCASHDDGTCTVAIQVPDGFDIPVFVRSEKFRPFVEPLRPMPENPNRCAVVVDGEPNVPWFSDVLYPHGTLGILHHHNRSWDLERHKTMAREKRLPLYFYIDSHDPDDVFFPPMPEDIAWIPMVQCYPHFTESSEDTRDRFSAIFWKAALFPRFAVYACGFRGLGTLDERTEQQLLNGLAIVAELAAKTPNCRLIVPFTWKRGANDGLVNLPRVLDAVRALQASVSEPDDYPTWAELKPAVPVTPPVTPKPPAPKPEPVVPNDRPHATKTTRQIAPGEILYPDTFIDAPGKGFRLYHQTDGQLVMLAMRPDGTSSPTGSTRTTDREPRTFVMQYEGNLVGYGAGKDYWASGIWRQDSKAIVTDAGQLVLEAQNGDRAAVDLKTGELTPIERAEPSQPHGSPSEARTGAVRLDGRAFSDDGGAFNPLGASLFWALWGERNDPDRLERNLAHLAAHGFDFIRMLGMVGAPSWEDRTIDPKASDYWAIVGKLFDRLKRHGLRAEVTIFADAQVMMPDKGQRRDFARTWGQFVEANRDRVLFVEMANEAWQNGFDDINELRELGRLIGTAAPVALSSAEHIEGRQPFAELYVGSAADVATIHYDRDTSKADGAWRPVRQPWGWPDEYSEHGGLPRAVVNNEPIGPHSSVAADADPIRIAMAYATTFVASNSAYVFHCGAGIRGGGAADTAKGRLANLFDYDPAIFTGLTAMRKLLPAGLANWQRHNSQWDSNPIAGFNKGVDDGRLMRFYAATSGKQFVGVVLNIRQPITVTARAAMDFDVHSPLDGSKVGSVSLMGGASWTCPAESPGLVLIGAHQ